VIRADFFCPWKVFFPSPISAGRAGKKFAPQTREDCLQRVQNRFLRNMSAGKNGRVGGPFFRVCGQI